MMMPKATAGRSHGGKPPARPVGRRGKEERLPRRAADYNAPAHGRGCFPERGTSPQPRRTCRGLPSDQNISPIFQGRVKQFPDYGEAQRTVVHQRLERMDRELNGHQFVAGDRYTIADITALVAIDIGGRLADIKIAPELAYLTRWYELVSSRPSANA